MKKKLIIEYKDGSKVNITNAKSTNTSVFVKYLREISVDRILNARVLTYPLKDNKPLILVENGVPRNDNVYQLTHKETKK